MSGSSNQRRHSERPRRKVDYTKGLEFDIEDDDYSYCSQILDSAVPAAWAAPADRRIVAASGTDAGSSYLVHSPSKGKNKFVRTYGERTENRMKSTCRALSIPYNLFDTWPGSRRPDQNSGLELIDLPYEILTSIFAFSRGSDLLSLRITCRIFKAMLEPNR